MIASIAAASSSPNALEYAFDRAGGALGPSSLDASTDLDAELADFNLPPPVLDNLRTPFEQLGFKLEPGTLNLEAHLPTPPGYTAARRPDLELALIQLPDFLFGASTTATVFIANGIGYVFDAGARLHLFAEQQDKPTDSLDTAMRSWTRVGVTAVFHPWGVIAEFDAATDRVEFVKRVFEVPDTTNGAAPDAVPATFDAALRRALHTGLLSAFRSYEDLEIMLRLHVDGRRLVDIVEETKLPFVVLKIIDAAEAEGWLAQLVKGAREYNPGNPELKSAALLIPVALGGEAR